MLCLQCPHAHKGTAPQPQPNHSAACIMIVPDPFCVCPCNPQQVTTGLFCWFYERQVQHTVKYSEPSGVVLWCSGDARASGEKSCTRTSFLRKNLQAQSLLCFFWSSSRLVPARHAATCPNSICQYRWRRWQEKPENKSPCKWKHALWIQRLVTCSCYSLEKRQLAMRILTLSAILGTLDGPQKSTKYRSSQNPAKFSSRKSSTMSQAQNLLLDLRSLGSGRGARIEAGIRYRRVTSARQTEKRNKRRYGMHLYASKIFQVFHHVLHTFCIK